MIGLFVGCRGFFVLGRNHRLEGVEDVVICRLEHSKVAALRPEQRGRDHRDTVLSAVSLRAGIIEQVIPTTLPFDQSLHYRLTSRHTTV